jgi:transposase-like protein
MSIEKALKNIGDWISKETESRKYPKSELLELSESLQALKAAIARQSVTEMVVCPDCGGSGVYQEYDEYDRYYVYACHECEGTGKIARQSVKSEEVQEAIVVVNEKIYRHREYIKLANKSSKAINLKPEYDKIDALKLAITALQEYQPWVSVSERLPEPPKRRTS